MPSLAEALTACGAAKFGSFTLSSGATSPYYVDVKQAMTDPATLRLVAHEMAALAAEHGSFDAVAGMELGAVPLATAVSLETGLPMLIVRKAGRAHGTAKRIEGRDAAGLRVLVVEDVATSGGSTVEAVKVLRDAAAKVDTALVVVDRESGAGEALSTQDVTLHALVTASELLSSPEAQAALKEVDAA